jgi:hypothetical protein
MLAVCIVELSRSQEVRDKRRWQGIAATPGHGLTLADV